jgi:hypothetical protein
LRDLDRVCKAHNVKWTTTMRMLAVSMLAACATTTMPAAKGGPRGLRADEHQDLARQHDEHAKQSSRWPDATVADVYGLPWTRSWDAGGEHERVAAAHRGKADALHVAYDEACGDRPLTKVSISPLQRFAVGGWNTQTGVILYLDPSAGAPDRLIADMKCHRAWMMLADTGMDDCPLDLPGLKLDARGDAEGITVSIAITDPELVPELQRRAAHDLEAGARLRASAR